MYGTCTHHGDLATIYNNAKLAAAGASYASKLFVNDAGALSDSKYGNGYAQNIEALRQAALNAGYGEVVGGIGLQFYESGLRSNMPSQFIAALQNFNVSGLPTELTEFGTFNGVNAADSATILGQAMRLMFGNPGSTGFINWDWTLEDNGANQWAPAAGLYTVNTATWDNWALTEAGKKWQDMLGIQDWDGNPKNGWTTQLNTTVDANGKIAFVGYYGDYQLTINGKVYNLSLVKGTSSYNLTAAIGDYNGDGIVDAADFTVWKDSLGSHFRSSRRRQRRRPRQPGRLRHLATQLRCQVRDSSRSLGRGSSRTFPRHPRRAVAALACRKGSGETSCLQRRAQASSQCLIRNATRIGPRADRESGESRTRSRTPHHARRTVCALARASTTPLATRVVPVLSRRLKLSLPSPKSIRSIPADFAAPIVSIQCNIPGEYRASSRL